MDIVVPNNDESSFKLCNPTLSNPLCDFILMEDTILPLVTDDIKILKAATSDTSKKCGASTDYEKMLYFVCNLCPYLCIKDTKITEHLDKIHKDNKKGSKPLQLKCPACPNVFFRNISLKAHLVHDHKVDASDLRQIIQAVIYYAKKSCNTVVKYNTAEKRELQPPALDPGCKNEIDIQIIEKLINSEKIITSDNGFAKEPEFNPNHCEVVEQVCMDETQLKQVEPETKIELPQINITEENIKSTLSAPVSIGKKTNTFSKVLDQRKVFKCTVLQCKVSMNEFSKMEYHIKCHTEHTFKCIECNETFGFWKPLTAHLWRVHLIDMELYSCDKCNYKTPSLGKLNNSHKLIHSDVRAFECDVCNKTFKNTKQLRNHRSIHKNKVKKFNYTCNTCSKAFSDRRQLNVHIDVVHKKLKPFACCYCGYRGASKSTLKMHVRQHTGEKPFTCDTCEYSTADHNSLRRHKLRHTGDKPYKCSHCNYACIQTSTYKEHIRTKHPTEEKDFVFNCQECAFRSVNQEMYLSHLFVVHHKNPNRVVVT